MKRRRLASGKGLLFVVSAPSGCGKTTIGKQLVLSFKRLARSISVTTRPPRKTEANGKDYHFVSKKEFLEKRKKGEFLEWALNFGYYYGTLKKTVEANLKKGNDVLLIIDVKGAQRVKRAFKECVEIFIMPPSMAELEKRLKRRGTDTKKDIERRLDVAGREMRRAQDYDYLVVNDTVENTVRQLKFIINFEKNSRIIKRRDK